MLLRYTMATCALPGQNGGWQVDVGLDVLLFVIATVQGVGGCQDGGARIQGGLQEPTAATALSATRSCLQYFLSACCAAIAA